MNSGPEPELVALFGPTGVGKTATAIELARLLRERGEDPVAVSCDAIQVYRGLEVLSGAADAAEQSELEHRLIGIAAVDEEFSAGRFAELARSEIDSLCAEGRRPILVGGTGLYMRAALAELELKPSVPEQVRAAVEAEIEASGSETLHAELPDDVAAKVHPNDRKRVARALELHRAGLDPPERSDQLWTARLRRPSRLFGLSLEREELDRRIARRVEAMLGAGAEEEARAAADAGASRTARAALGFEALIAGERDAVAGAHRRYARRQMTWMKKMDGLTMVPLDPGGAAAAAAEIAASL